MGGPSGRGPRGRNSQSRALVIGAFEIDASRAQQAMDDGDRLGKAADAMVERVAKGDVLRLVPTGAETENEAPTGDLVDGIGDLRQQGRVAERGAAHQRADLDPGGHRRQSGEQGPALPRSLHLLSGEAIDEVVRVPDGIEAELLGHPGHLDQIAPASRRATHLPLGVGQDESDLQRPGSGGASRFAPRRDILAGRHGLQSFPVRLRRRCAQPAALGTSSSNVRPVAASASSSDP